MSDGKIIQLDPQADGIHQIGPEPWWREAWYFEFFDPRTRLQVQGYQGVFPNAGKGDLIFYVFKDGQLKHPHMKMDYTIPHDIGQERLCFGPLKLDLVEPLKVWRLRYDSHGFQCDILFSGLHPPFSWAESHLWMEDAPSGEQSRHFDQFGRYSGWACLDGEMLDVSALGMRDRMWGWGARSKWDGYYIMWAPFNEELVANVAALRFADGRSQLCGYIHSGQSRSTLGKARIEIEWSERRWKSIETVRVGIEDVSGKALELVGKPLGIIDTSRFWFHRQDHMLFSIAEYDWRGHKAYGCMNWSFVNADRRPSVVDLKL